MSEKFVVYGKEGCVYCGKAVELLKSVNAEVDYLLLDEHFTKTELLEKIPDVKSFPQIYHYMNGKENYIGSYETLLVMLSGI